MAARLQSRQWSLKSSLVMLILSVFCNGSVRPTANLFPVDKSASLIHTFTISPWRHKWKGQRLDRFGSGNKSCFALSPLYFLVSHYRPFSLDLISFAPSITMPNNVSFHRFLLSLTSGSPVAEEMGAARKLDMTIKSPPSSMFIVIIVCRGIKVDLQKVGYHQ